MLYIHGLGHFHSENVIDNAFLESLDIGTSSEWIWERVGIRARRTVLSLDYIRSTMNADVRAASEASLYSNAETGALAARLALKRASLLPSDIGMVIAGSCSPEHLIPAEASLIAQSLGISCPAFDLHAACSTFGAHLHFLEKMTDSLPEFVLVVCPENVTRAVDFSDRKTAVLFGDATSAAIVSTRVPSNMGLVVATFDASPAGAREVTIPRAGYFFQNGAHVQKFAIKRTVSIFADLTAVAELRDQPYFVGHQANWRMLENVVRRIGINPARHLSNVEHFGNQCSAGGPSVVSQHWQDFRPGDELVMALVGSGLSWSGAAFRWS